jgi:hypothetical protein
MAAQIAARRAAEPMAPVAAHLNIIMDPTRHDLAEILEEFPPTESG